MIFSYIGFGSNLGDRESNISSALHLLSLSPSLKILRMSSLYETEPVDGVDGECFLNGVVKLETTLQAPELLAFLQSVEEKLGRDHVRRQGPRTIDLDILLFGDLVVRAPDLVIPHPKMDRRRFVLIPLLEIEPSATHPVLKRPLRDLLSEIENTADVVHFGAVAHKEHLS